MYSIVQLSRKISVRLEGWYNARKPRIFFMHLGKCGGSSVAYNLRSALQVGYDGFINSQQTIDAVQCQNSPLTFKDFLASLNQHRIALAYQLMSRDVPFITGHVPFHFVSFSKFPHYDFVTVVREPVDRIKSSLLYRYVTGRPLVDGDKRSNNFEIEVEKFVNSERAKYECNHLSESFGGFNGDWRRAMENAPGNLGHFRVIGDTTCIGDFYKRLHVIYGVQPKNKKYNVTDHQSMGETSELKKIVNLTKFENAFKELSRHDVDLYMLIKKSNNYVK